MDWLSISARTAFMLTLVLIFSSGCGKVSSSESKTTQTTPSAPPSAPATSTNATQAPDAMAGDAMTDSERDAIKANELYVSLEEQMRQIRVKKSKPDFSISFEKLPAKWSVWRKNYYYLSVITIDSDGSLGLAGGFQGRFDADGNYTLPTKSGSIFIFEPTRPNATWAAVAQALFNGITIQATGTDKIYFGVMEEYGIVHLRGAGTAIMPDGTTINLK